MTRRFIGWTKNPTTGDWSKGSWVITSTPRSGWTARYRGVHITTVSTVADGKDYCDNSGYAREAAARIDAEKSVKLGS